MAAAGYSEDNAVNRLPAVRLLAHTVKGAVPSARLAQAEVTR
jgi:hypothetical protein